VLAAGQGTPAGSRAGAATGPRALDNAGRPAQIPPTAPRDAHLPSVVRTRVTAREGGRSGTLERVTWLTPYTAETIAQDARRAGAGARLEVTVPKETSAARLAAVESMFAWLREKGIEVTVRRDEEEA